MPPIVRRGFSAAANKSVSKQTQSAAKNPTVQVKAPLSGNLASKLETFPVNLISRNAESGTRTQPAKTATSPTKVLKSLNRLSRTASWVTQHHQHALETSPNRLLTRDFIHDSLYNLEYGYFSKRATIFSPPEDIEFNKLKSANDFMEHIARLYSEYDEVEENGALQVWHTPTEMFKPYYGYAIADYILSEFDKQKDQDTLVIYEMGAGNGTMMRNIIQYIQRKRPEVFKKLKYNIIEISRQLTERQEWSNMSQLHRQAHRYRNQVQIINKSIFDWDQYEDKNCFIIAMEVIDNFAHDAVRYQLATSALNPVQTFVVTDKETGQMTEEFEPVTDPLIRRYLDLRAQTGYTSPVLPTSEWQRSLRQQLPFAPNLTEPEFLPTMQLCFMEKLFEMFPKHRLILSDFNQLPTEVTGVDAPVVQTRQRYSMIPCSTYMVTRGWFDIFFPTNFELMANMYALLSRRYNAHQPASTVSTTTQQYQPAIMTHRQFLEAHGDLVATRTRNGENPMLQHYTNMQFLLT